LEGLLILLQLDPVNLRGVELIIDQQGTTVKTEREFDEEIYQDLVADEFEPASPLEFNLYLNRSKILGLRS
jgi:hypothetical protein